MTVPDVHVGRHVITCRTSASGAGERALRGVVDLLPADLAGALQGVGLHGYWIIRRLDVSSHLGAAWASSRMAAAVSQKVAGEVAEVVRHGHDPDAVLWFPDRAAFVSRFLLDLAEGRAAGRWEYAQFGADARPQDAAIDLARDEPDILQEALEQLTDAELVRVAAGLDGDAVLAALVAGGEAAPLVGPVIDALGLLGPRLPERGAALVLAVVAVRASGRGLVAVADPARAVAAVLPGLRRAPEAGLDALRHGRWVEVASLTGSGAVVPLVHWPPEARASLAEAMGGPTRPVATGRRCHTDFGGIFLLAPILDDLWSWRSATSTWPGEDSDRIAKLLCVTAALGCEQHTLAARDSLVRAVLGVSMDLEPVAWVEGLGERHAKAFAAEVGSSLDVEPMALAEPLAAAPVAELIGRTAAAAVRALGRRLPGMAAASPPYLVRNVLDLDAWVTTSGDESVVELGRPPLAVLVSMAGLDRGSFVVDGVAGERRWTLTTTS